MMYEAQTDALRWRFFPPTIWINYNRLFGGFIWISLEDRGCNVGRYLVKTIGLDGVP